MKVKKTIKQEKHFELKERPFNKKKKKKYETKLKTPVTKKSNQKTHLHLK